ncbi:MAG: hypothetical protein IT321_28935 [Anaerolineae bacterium]|nr:hypothetical protein [Anaerolineae bacterium]
MYRKFSSPHRLNRFSRFLVLALVIAGVFTFMLNLQPAEAHCDSEQGPVANAAFQALDTNDVSLVLPYVAPDMEAELSAAFDQAVAVRQLGGDAAQLADKYFVETAVRLHRTSEGASFTGVTDEAVPEAIVMADEAMAGGSLDAVYEFLNAETREGIETNYHKVVEAREHAATENTVEANRERVEAELGFEKYIYELYLTITGPVGHEGEIEGGHQH